MSFTFENQQDLLSILVGDSNEGSDDAFPTAVRKKYINRGEWHFAIDTKFVREKATGTVSSLQISVPSDWFETYALIVGDYVLTKDDEISIKDYERWSSYGGSRPKFHMSEESGTRYFKFLGSANSLAYSLYYFKKPSTELSGDSDTSIFPEEFREASVYWAAGELLQQQGKNAIADKYKAIYNKYVHDAQALVERIYVDRDYAVPDTNQMGDQTTDFQGRGYDFA